MRIITINLPETYIKTIEHLIGDKALYPSRSELIRVAVREFLIRELQSANQMENLIAKKDQIIYSQPKQTEIIIKEILMPNPITKQSNEDKKPAQSEIKPIIEKPKEIPKSPEDSKQLINKPNSIQIPKEKKELDNEYAKVKARVKTLIREINEINRKPTEQIMGGFKIVPKELINKKHELKMIIEENKGKFNFEPIIESVLKETPQTRVLTNP